MKVRDSEVKDTVADNGMGRDGVDRRGFLKCMAWAGTGILWTVRGGILQSTLLSAAATAQADEGTAPGDFSFVQISDSHIGFHKDANPDVVGTFQQAINRIRMAGAPPSFIIHTGDITHTAEPAQFDTVSQMLQGAKFNDVFYVPGEHDLVDESRKLYRERYGKGTHGDGWYSFTQKGVHFIGLVNVAQNGEGGLGILGAEQLEWLERDLKPLSTSTPIVVFAHIPLWAVYPQWGWGTEDSAQALSYLKRFGSVTVLNGHIHQVLQKVEGNITFHTAASTAFPQPAPGQAPNSGPMKVEADRLQKVLGITRVDYREGKHTLAVVDTFLANGDR